MSTKTINPGSTIKELHSIRDVSLKDSHIALDKVNKGVDWELLAGSISDKLNTYGIDYKSSNLVYVLKALTLEILFDIPVHRLNTEITDRKSYQKFLGIHNFMEIPSATLCSDVKNALYDKVLYDNLINIIEIVLTEKDVPVFHNGFNGNIDSKIDQIEERVKKIQSFDKKDNFEEFEEEKEIDKSISFKQEIDIEKSKLMTEKLKEVNEKIDKLLLKEVKKETPQETPEVSGNKVLMDKLQEINDRLQKLTIAETKAPEAEKKEKVSEDVYKKLFDSFYNQLQTPAIEEKIAEEKQGPAIEFISEQKTAGTDETTAKLSRIEDEIKKLYAKISEQELPKPKSQPVIKEKIVSREKVVVPKIIKEEITEETEEPENEIDLKKKKRYHIFNNTNLTEDYELGLRFYKLGYKTAFINMRADDRDENSRIATAEYFPNSFWGSVKQRSRWIAGIVFQNWKIHKWQGNLKTKYFLLRDRKAIFSFFGIFLSNVVFTFFCVYMAGLMFNFYVSEPIVQKGSALWYLMIATLFFLINRVIHRFATTYNWYGFKYAALSIVRLLFDNLINLFATLRAIKVYNTNKRKIVWDSTDHY